MMLRRLPLCWTCYWVIVSGGITASSQNTAQMQSPFDPTTWTLAYGPPFCTCDLNKGTCDTDCCCDIDCNCQQLAGFSIDCGCSGLPAFNYLCSTTTVVSSAEYGPNRDLHQLLCITKETNPIVGQFFPPFDPGFALSTSTAFDELLQVRSDARQYSFARSIAFSSSQFLVGTPMELFNESIPSQSGTLLQPYPILGECSTFGAATFLEPGGFTCSRALGPTCDSDLSLNIHHFVVGLEGLSLSVRGSLGGEIASTTLTVIRTDGSSFDGPWTESSLNALNAIYDIEEKVCLNIVAEVQYKVTWNGRRIANLETTILLRNFAADQTFEQKVSTFFRTNKTGVEFAPRSGNPGYRIGENLLLADGTPVTMLSASNMFLDDTVIPKTEELKFGFDAISGVQVLVDPSLNCSDVRQRFDDVLRQGMAKLGPSGSLIRTYGSEGADTVPIVFKRETSRPFTLSEWASPLSKIEEYIVEPPTNLSSIRSGIPDSFDPSTVCSRFTASAPFLSEAYSTVFAGTADACATICGRESFCTFMAFSMMGERSCMLFHGNPLPTVVGSGSYIVGDCRNVDIPTYEPIVEEEEDTHYDELFCSGILTEVKLTVLIALQGDKHNPQRRVVGVQMTDKYTSIPRCPADQNLGETSQQGSQTMGWNSHYCLNPKPFYQPVYHNVEFRTINLPRGQATSDQIDAEARGNAFGGDVPFNFFGCRETTCTFQMFYPFYAPWDSNLEYQKRRQIYVANTLVAVVSIVFAVGIGLMITGFGISGRMPSVHANI